MQAGKLIGKAIGKVRIARLPWYVPALALALTAIGAAFILSADGPATAKRQLEFAALGCAAFAAMAVLDYRHLGTFAVPIYMVGILTLACLPLLGVERNNATRWYDLGVFMFQPSELMKLILVVALAEYFRFRQGLGLMRTLAIPLLLTFVPMFLIAGQPDVGTALMLLPTFFVIAFLAGVRVRNLAVLVCAGCLLAVAAWFSPVLKDYQKERVIAFVRPELVEGSNAAEHSQQVLRAIRAGGWHGEGWGRGVLNRRRMLSERHTDFIFAVVAEEWGFYRTAGVVCLYLLLIAALGHVTARTQEPFGRLLAGGVLSIVGVQALVNMAIAVRLAPITGLTLPLLSYGGSSLLCTFAALGLAASVRTHRGDSWMDEQPDGPAGL